MMDPGRSARTAFMTGDAPVRSSYERGGVNEAMCERKQTGWVARSSLFKCWFQSGGGGRLGQRDLRGDHRASADD